jgi:Streptococcus thermophilus bacteriophage Gp111 protein.
MNVMKRAWEIAKEAAAKFGGNSKEYFAEALRMAWASKTAPTPHFGFNEIAKQNGGIMFTTEQNESLKVSFIWQEKNGITGKMVTKRKEIAHRNVVNNTTKQKARYYAVYDLNCQLEFATSEKVEVLTIERGKLAWN